MASWTDWLAQNSLGGTPQGLPDKDWSIEDFYGTGLEPLLVEGAGVSQPDEDSFNMALNYAWRNLPGKTRKEARKAAKDKAGALSDYARSYNSPMSKELRDYIAANANVSRRSAIMGLDSDPRAMVWPGDISVNAGGSPTIGQSVGFDGEKIFSWAAGPLKDEKGRKKGLKKAGMSKVDVERDIAGRATVPSHERAHTAAYVLASSYPDDPDVARYLLNEDDLQHRVIGRLFEKMGIDSDDRVGRGEKELDPLIKKLESLSAELVKKKRPRGGR